VLYFYGDKPMLIKRCDRCGKDKKGLEEFCSITFESCEEKHLCEKCTERFYTFMEYGNEQND